IWWKLLSPSDVIMQTLYTEWPPSTRIGLSAEVVFRYYQWRLRKPNASPRDRFRSEAYVKYMWQGSSERGKSELIRYLMLPVLQDLCFKDAPTQQVDETLRLLILTNSTVTTQVVVPALIECLRTENADNRLRIHRTLLDLQRINY